MIDEEENRKGLKYTDFVKWRDGVGQNYLYDTFMWIDIADPAMPLRVRVDKIRTKPSPVPTFDFKIPTNRYIMDSPDLIHDRGIVITEIVPVSGFPTGANKGGDYFPHLKNDDDIVFIDKESAVPETAKEGTPTPVGDDVSLKPPCDCWLAERPYDTLVHLITNKEGRAPYDTSVILCGAPFYDSKKDVKRLITPASIEKRGEKKKPDPTCTVCLSTAKTVDKGLLW